MGRAKRIDQDERDRLLSQLARLPIGDVARDSGRSVIGLARLWVANHKS
jgi:hypothetical protein